LLQNGSCFLVQYLSVFVNAVKLQNLFYIGMFGELFLIHVDLQRYYDCCYDDFVRMGPEMGKNTCFSSTPLTVVSAPSPGGRGVELNAFKGSFCKYLSCVQLR
jgi:hypothetical protein